MRLPIHERPSTSAATFNYQNNGSANQMGEDYELDPALTPINDEFMNFVTKRADRRKSTMNMLKKRIRRSIVDIVESDEEIERDRDERNVGTTRQNLPDEAITGKDLLNNIFLNFSYF